MPPTLTPVAFVNAVVTAFKRRGLSPAHALAVTQIALQLLADPASRITSVQMERVSSAAMQALDQSDPCQVSTPEQSLALNNAKCV